MNKLLLFSVSCIGLVFITLALPYMEYDYYQVPSVFKDLDAPKLIKKDILITGTNTTLPFLPIAWMAILAIIVHLRKTPKMAMVGFIGSLILLILMYLLGRGLKADPSIFYGVKKLKLLSGFYLSFFAVFAYTIVLFINLLYLKKNRKQ